ncbi:MAG: hypothetical protein ACK5M5_01290, partial [Limnobaculum xujianqingii]
MDVDPAVILPSTIEPLIAFKTTSEFPVNATASLLAFNVELSNVVFQPPSWALIPVSRAFKFAYVKYNSPPVPVPFKLISSDADVEILLKT